MLESLGPYADGVAQVVLLVFSPILVYTFLAAKERLMFMCTGLLRPYDEWFP